MENRRKTPTWGSVIGVLGIIFGALGMLGGTYELIMPKMIDMQQEMMVAMKEQAQAEQKRKSQQPNYPDDSSKKSDVDPTAMFDSMEKMWRIPPWYRTWSLVNGALALILGAAYILAAIFLIIVRAGAPTIFVGVAGLSIIRNLAALGLGISAGSFVAFWSASSSAMGLLIDLVLVIIVLVSDRSPYFNKTTEATR